VKKNPAKAIPSGDCFIFRGHILNESSLVALIAYFGYFGLALQTPIVIDSLETMPQIKKENKFYFKEVFVSALKFLIQIKLFN